MHKNHLIKSVAVLAMLASGCSRQTDCAANKCDNKVSPAFAGPGSATAEKTEGSVNPNPSEAPPNPAPVKELENLAALLKMQEAITKLEQAIIFLEDKHFGGLETSIRAFSGISDALSSWQTQAAEELGKATEHYKNEGAKLHLNLEAFAAERESLRLGLFLELEAAEAELFQALDPEGVGTQVMWDRSFLTALDNSREQSKTPEIIAIRKQMLDAAESTFAANQATLKSAIINVIDKNLALVTANAPANADRFLIMISELEKVLAVATITADVQKALNEKLTAAQARIKLALDAINPEFFKQLEQLVMRREIAKATLSGLSSGIGYFKEFSKSQAAKLASIQEKIAELNIAAIALRMKAIKQPQNGQIIGQSLGTTTFVVGEISKRIDAIVDGIKQFQSELLDIIKKQDGKTLLAGIDPNSSTAATNKQIEALSSGEDALGQAVGQLSGSLQNLANIFEAVGTCQSGTVSLVNEMPVNTISCGGEELKILDAPPQGPKPGATN